MKIHVGSMNISKVQAVKEIAREYRIWSDAEVIGVKTDSGISDQPIGMEETARGAVNRAKAALEQGADVGVGIEAGLIDVPQTQSKYMNVSICAIADKNGVYLGTTSAFEMPRAVMERVLEEGKEISPAMVEAGYISDVDTAKNEGVISILTNGRVNRVELNKQALVNALIHLEHPDWY